MSNDEIPPADDPSDGIEMQTPKVSVIIPCYNRKKYIKECINSVLASSLELIEVICVDDGSTDGTTELLEKISYKDPRIVFVKTNHEGAYQARWCGLQYARGEYVHFMDSDDLIAPGAYEELVSICDENNLDQIVFTAASFNSEKHTQSEAKVKDGFDKHYQLANECCEKVMDGKELFRLLCKNRSFFVGFPMRLIRRCIVQMMIPACDAVWHADNFYTVVWMYRSKHALAINRKYYKRRVHRNSITMVKDFDSQHFKSILSVVLAFCRFDEFVAEGVKQGTEESNYITRLLRGLYKRLSKMDGDEALAISRVEVGNNFLSFSEFFGLCFLPLLRKAMK